MAGVAFSIRAPDISKGARADWARVEKDHRKAAVEVLDLASKKAQAHIQAKMRGVGLGGLANAVGQTSTLKKRQAGSGGNPYGAIYAKGGDESRAGGALEAYSQGATITARHGTWLAYPTKAAPRIVVAGGRRRRLTPKLWQQAGLESRIGKLVFRQIRADLALLVVRKVSLSPKTGQAKALGKRAPRTRIVADGDVVVFVLIRYTRRAKRFDKDEIVEFYANRVPDYLRITLAGYNAGTT